MKKLFFIIVMFITGFINSQVIKVNVYEGYDAVGYEESIIDVIKDEARFQFYKNTNCTYLLNFTDKTLKFYRNGKLESECNIEFVNIGSEYSIRFLYEGYNIGMIIDLIDTNKRIYWYSDDAPSSHVVMFTKSEIDRGL